MGEIGQVTSFAEKSGSGLLRFCELFECVFRRQPPAFKILAEKQFQGHLPVHQTQQGHQRTLTGNGVSHKTNTDQFSEFVRRIQNQVYETAFQRF